MLMNRILLLLTLVLAEVDNGNGAFHANSISQVQISVLPNPSMDKNLKFL